MSRETGIDPQDARVHGVGKIEPLGRPTFVGRDRYLSGLDQLRRIRNVVPAPRGRVSQKHDRTREVQKEQNETTD